MIIVVCAGPLLILKVPLLAIQYAGDNCHADGDHAGRHECQCAHADLQATDDDGRKAAIRLIQGWRDPG